MFCVATAPTPARTQLPHRAATQMLDELRRVWDLYEKEMDAYVIRAIDPTQAPSYGVPGDE